MYTRSYVSINDGIILKLCYFVSKSLHFQSQLFYWLPQRTAVTYLMLLFYQGHSNVSESTKIQSHGNAKRTNATSKLYYRTPNEVLVKTNKLLKTGMQAKAVYDKINGESGGA